MYRGGIAGFATPRLVHGCTIRNASNATVYVRILYQAIVSQRDELFERRVEFQLAKGAETYIEEVEFDKGSYQIRETIDIIEVTRSNGRTQEIHAPFDNVNGIELDWLFVIDNINIRSVKRNS